MAAMHKPAETAFPIHELLASRWSPVGFGGRQLTTAELGSLLEAARWAPSSYNEQPWAFVVARQEDGPAFGRLLECLVPANQAWARDAAALLCSVAKLRFGRNDKENRHALHDVGLAVGNLVTQATSMGLSVHQMAGFDATRARAQLGIPKGWEPVAFLAIGQAREHPDADLRQRDAAARSRRTLEEIVHGGQWGHALEGVTRES
jgi:nitroreductase